MRGHTTTHALATLTLVTLSALACIQGPPYGPDDPTEPRGEGAPCDMNLDCVIPLVCDQASGLCAAIDTPSSALDCPRDTRPSGDVSCAQICDYMAGECRRSEGDCVGQECLDLCVASCEETIRCWSAEAATTFGNCSLGNSDPRLTCDIAVTREAPSFCYSQIPLPEARKAVCDDLIASVEEYASEPDPYDVADMAKFCYRLGRTYTEEDFSATYACDESRDATLTPNEVVECVNEVFGLDFVADDAPTNNAPINNPINNPSEPEADAG